MKKINKIILITIAILFWIFAPLLIILLPEIKTSVKDIVLNSKDVSDIIGLYFGSIPIVASAVIVWMSVEEMKKQNKISVDSVKEMKKQNELIRDKEDRAEIIAYMEKVLPPIIDELRSLDINNPQSMFDCLDNKLKPCLDDIWCKFSHNSLGDDVFDISQILIGYIHCFWDEQNPNRKEHLRNQLIGGLIDFKVMFENPSIRVCYLSRFEDLKKESDKMLEEQEKSE